jgi:hypothetical protein
MPSFVLRAIDPALWARVQVKAAAEGITVKAFILKVLAAGVAPVLLLSLLGLGLPACAYDDAKLTPTTPTTTPAPYLPPVAQPLPNPTVQPTPPVIPPPAQSPPPVLTPPGPPFVPSPPPPTPPLQITSLTCLPGALPLSATCMAVVTLNGAAWPLQDNQAIFTWTFSSAGTLSTAAPVSGVVQFTAAGAYSVQLVVTDVATLPIQTATASTVALVQ